MVLFQLVEMTEPVLYQYIKGVVFVFENIDEPSNEQIDIAKTVLKAIGKLTDAILGVVSTPGE